MLFDSQAYFGSICWGAATANSHMSPGQCFPVIFVISDMGLQLPGTPTTGAAFKLAPIDHLEHRGLCVFHLKPEAYGSVVSAAPNTSASFMLTSPVAWIHISSFYLTIAGLQVWQIVSLIFTFLSKPLIFRQSFGSFCPFLLLLLFTKSCDHLSVLRLHCKKFSCINSLIVQQDPDK